MSPGDNPLPKHGKTNHAVVFLHLDLGIGGAERLIIELAKASVALGHNVTIYTTHCSPDHCFREVKPGSDGELYSKLRVRGAWLPQRTVFGGTAIFSALRMLYLGAWAAVAESDADLYVLDVLPTPIPLLRFMTRAAVLFYCHFPDRFLTRDTVNGDMSTISVASPWMSLVRRIYRSVVDLLEAFTMATADLVSFNSHFTEEVVLSTFGWRVDKEHHRVPKMCVLHPCIDDPKESSLANDNGKWTSKIPHKKRPIVSLNRFERKKNVGILLRACAHLRKKQQAEAQNRLKVEKGLEFPPIVVAGGYDPRNIENVEHLQELEALAAELQLQVQFRPNVSEIQRKELLSSALCLCYTPHREHFGIVPLEASALGTPVVAIDSGGPRETVVHGVTGLRVPPNAALEGFSNALELLMTDMERRDSMGKAAVEHARTFGTKVFRRKWADFTEEAIRLGIQRRKHKRTDNFRSLFYVIVVAFLPVALTTLLWFFFLH